MQLEAYIKANKIKSSAQRVNDYEYSRKIFLILFRFLRKSVEIPSAEQFEGLYFALRWCGRVSAERKLEQWANCYSNQVADHCKIHLNERHGLVGGGKGSVTLDLKSVSNRKRFWYFLTRVADCRGIKQADQVVLEYVKNPVKGLGRSVVSSFLWALQPEMFPIVNGGNIKGLCASINHFPAKNDLSAYAAWEVLCLRDFKNAYSIRSFAVLDRLMLELSSEVKAGLSIAEKSRFVYDQGEDLQIKLQEGAVEERKVFFRTRNAKLRDAVIRERGYRCQICDMSFLERYGVDYAEVHHLVPLAQTGQRETGHDDLLVVCRNCHAMLHSSAFEGRSWKHLRNKVLRLRNGS